MARNTQKTPVFALIDANTRFGLPIKCPKMQTVGNVLRADAERAGIPLRTLEQVKTALARAKRTKADKALARIMLNHGRLTEEARAYVIEYANHIWQCEAYGIKR